MLCVVRLIRSVCVYSDDDKDAFYQTLHACLDRISSRDSLIVLGDFNARVDSDRSSWPGVLGPFGGSQTSANGERLLSSCMAYKLSVMGTWFAHKDIHKMTWLHPNGTSSAQIDHVLVRQHLRQDILDVRVYRGADISTQAPSGHRLVLVKFRRHFSCQSSSRPIQRLALDKLRDASVVESMQERIMASYEIANSHPVLSVSDEWSSFSTSIITAAESILGRTRSRRSSKWISDATLVLVDQKRAARQVLLSCSAIDRSTNSLTYANLARAVKRSCRADKEAWWSNQASILERCASEHLLKPTFGVLKQLCSKPGRHCETLKNKNGVTLDSADAVLTRWTEHFREILKADVDFPDTWSSPLDLPPDPDSSLLTPQQLSLITVPSLAEVELAVKKMGLGKAAGMDEICAELLRFPPCIRWLHRLITAVWHGGTPPQAWIDAVAVPLYKGKGSASDCDNYRGIMLLSVPGKVYGRILASRLALYAEDLLCEHQNGFRKGRSCMDAIFVLRQIMELSRDQQQQLFIAFIDFSKAYDSVVRGRLWDILREYSIPDSFIFRVAALHHRTSVRVRVAGVLGPEFRTKLGLRQGCVMAPVLFNLYLDAVLRRTPCLPGVSVEVVPRSQLLVPNSFRLSASISIGLTDVRFADDVAVFADSRAALQASLSHIEQTCLPENLHISSKKTKVMVIGTDSSSLEPCIVSSSKLDYVDCFTYLGSDVFSDCDVHKEVTRRLGKAFQSFSSLMTPLWKRREVSVQTKLRICNAVALSTLLYGAETWALTANDLRRLEAFYMYCLRRILRLSWMSRVTNIDVRNRCQVPTLEAILRQRRLRWLGHVQRMSDQRLPKALLWGRLPKCKRRQGGQKKRWIDICHQDLHDLQLTETWKTLCLDRPKWSKYIKAVDRVSRSDRARAVRKIKSTELSQTSSSPVTLINGTLASTATTSSTRVTRSGTRSSGASVPSIPLSSAPAAITTPLCVPSAPAPSTLQVRSTRRATVAERAHLTVICDVCHRHFARESDRKRHRCTTTRKKS